MSDRVSLSFCAVHMGVRVQSSSIWIGEKKKTKSTDYSVIVLDIVAPCQGLVHALILRCGKYQKAVLYSIFVYNPEHLRVHAHFVSQTLTHSRSCTHTYKKTHTKGQVVFL